MKKHTNRLNIDEKWLKFAEEDYKLVSFLYNKQKDFYRSICFHAQQFVEKILKGILEGAGLSPLKIHDINALVKRVSKLGIIVPLKEREILFLSSIYIDVRYPPDVGLLPNGEPSRKDVDIAVEAVRRLKRWVS